MSWGVNNVGYLGQAPLVPVPVGNEVVEISPSPSLEQTDLFVADSPSEKKDNFSYIGDFVTRAEQSGDSWLINSQDFLELKKVVDTYSYAFREQDASDELKQKINQKLEEKGYLTKAKSLDRALAQEQELRAQEQKLQAQEQKFREQKKDKDVASTAYSALTHGTSTEETEKTLSDPWLEQARTGVARFQI